MSTVVLAIETSCDDTSVAVVEDSGWVHSCVSASQDLQHQDFGGIVPEIASRNHSFTLLPLVEEALKKSGKNWSDLSGIAVTNRPGLMGSLIVGLMTAKSLSMAKGLPFLGVNHLEGHLLAPFLKDQEYSAPTDFSYPYIGLAISGGHTSLYQIHGLGQYQVLGATKDDAAGEAFDKFAKLIGLGFPGGVKVDHLAKQGDVRAFEFPRSMINEENFDMSFSGLKSAAQRLVQSMKNGDVLARQADLCASYQEAIVDVLLAKLERAAVQTGLKKIILTGGVSANSRLRERAQELASKRGYTLVIPPIRYCTDNAAMIGLAGALRMARGERSDLTTPASAQALPNDFIARRF